MSGVLIVLFVFLTSPLGWTFVIQLSEEDAAAPASSAISASSVLRTNRCQRKPLQAIRESILQGLNLKQAPRHQGIGMAELREQWKAAFKVSGHSGHPIQPPPHMTGNGHAEAPSTEQQCCKLSSQIFITDLGWENWIIYPESFTFTQCSACSPQPMPSGPLCPSTPPTGTSPQVPRCHAVAHDLVPFFYLDESSALVISSVPMIRRCGNAPAPPP